MSADLRRDFANRDDLAAYLREQFPEASGELSPIVGGLAEAHHRLQRLDPARYAATRNYLDGAVTGLSPYIRHGVLSLPEVRDAALQRASKGDCAKLINELGWRDYWQRIWAREGDGIWDDCEEYKTGHWQYARELPEDLREGATGLPCIDGFIDELYTTGYLHNHARMWLAAYVVHWRRVRWQAGARWFLEHLLDGDPASNNLSWQWVASTFSHKPYFFNRENLEKYTGGSYCRSCPVRGHCDFEGSYDQIERRLFKLPMRDERRRR
ncbi:MAG: FAD-binding domain-containing protein [Gemmataceae bacterium]